jgi:multiple sugar transport system substrate-binding protein
MRKSRFILLALALMLVLSYGLVNAQDKVTVRVWTGASSPVEDAFKQQQVKDFEAANPDITVDLQILPDYSTQLQTAFASGDYPEVFTVQEQDFPSREDSGVLADGADKIVSQDDFYPGLKAAFSYDGDLYCAPKDYSTLGLLYNKDLFDKAKLAYPTPEWTWDDLKNAAKTLTSGDVVGMSVDPNPDRWEALFYGNGAQLFDKDGNVVFNSPEGVAALDFYASFIKDGTGKTPADLNAGWNGEAFGNAKAAMTIEGNWAIGYLNQTFPDLKWGVTEVPLAPATGKHGSLTFSECWAVGADATGATADAAWKVVNFFTDPDAAKTVGSQGFGVIPARPSAADSWVQKVGADYHAFTDAAAYAVAPILPLGYADFDKAVRDGSNAVIAGTETAQQMMDDAAKVAQDIQSSMGTATPSS